MLGVEYMLMIAWLSGRGNVVL